MNSEDSLAPFSGDMRNMTIDVGRNPLSKESKAKKHISLLLGAGFSIPAGYPLGEHVNKGIIEFENKNVAFSPDGTLVERDNDDDSDFSHNSKSQHFKIFLFCNRLIKLYNEKNGGFDYENFYDFIRPNAENADVLIPYYRNGCAEFCGTCSYERMLWDVLPVFNQMVESLIKTKKDSPSADYKDFLNMIGEWSEDHFVDIHTLNHDLLFESFRRTFNLTGIISDGFDEYGSRYYGRLHCKDETHTVRLERYTGRYTTPVRLYKLHGSIDYVLFHSDRTGSLMPDKYVKRKCGMNYADLLRADGSKMRYEKYPCACHADFLTGTESKIKRYGEPFFKKLFHKFVNNLKNAEELIIIGYGCKDRKINQIITDNFDFRRKPSYIVDISPSEVVENFCRQINAKLVKSSVDKITGSTFQCTPR